MQLARPFNYPISDTPVNNALEAEAAKRQAKVKRTTTRGARQPAPHMGQVDAGGTVSHNTQFHTY